MKLIVKLDDKTAFTVTSDEETLCAIQDIFYSEVLKLIVTRKDTMVKGEPIVVDPKPRPK